MIRKNKEYDVGSTMIKVVKFLLLSLRFNARITRYFGCQNILRHLKYNPCLLLTIIYTWII